MAVTDQNLYNEIQYHLMETPNNGASFSSSLYTVAEMVARTNYRADLFNKLTGAFISKGTQDASAATKSQDISTAAPNFIDILDVFYTPDAGTTWYNIPRGSAIEADELIRTQTSVSIPSIWTLDVAKVLGITFFPAPTFSSTNGQLTILYVRKLGTFSSTPDGSSLSIPDDFTPFIKYGALADLFGKAGETYDPMRASICESLFQMGVEVTKGWLTGTNT